MSVRMITYDLRKPGRDYSGLYKAIESIAGARWHCVESVWLVRTAKDNAAIREILTPHLDVNDKLLVGTIGPGWATTGFETECNQWLRDNV